MHVVFICDELPPAPGGGIGTCVQALASGIAARGADFQVTIIGTYRQEYSWVLPGVRIVSILQWDQPLRRRILRLNDISLRAESIFRALIALNQDHKIDLIEWPDYKGLRSRRCRQIPNVCEVVRLHGTRLMQSRLGLVAPDPVLETRERRQLAAVPRWISVSHWYLGDVAHTVSVKPVRTCVISNPVDVQLFHPAWEREVPAEAIGPKIVLFAGTIDPSKGAGQAAAAANLFLTSVPGSELWFVGRVLNAEILNRLESTIEPCLRSRVRFMHPVSQSALAELMRGAAVFLLPSYRETFGNVWAEAMASGLPVVASKRCAGPETVPSACGVCVNPDDIAAIATEVTELLQRPDRRRSLGQAGREFAIEHYAADVVVEETCRFYRDCLTAGS